MIKTLHKLGVAALVLACAVAVHAQEKTAVPLKVQVVIARYEGEKKISSMPYVLSVNAGRKATLRMGTSVPIPMTTFTPAAAGGPNVNPITSYNYRDIGTNIDCSTSALDDGRFVVELNIEDNAVEEQSRTSATQLPSLRNFHFTNSLVLKDAQSAQFTTAVDKITGVVTKVDVTLTVVK